MGLGTSNMVATSRPGGGQIEKGLDDG